MDISVLVSWKTIPRPTGWTLGRCPHCEAITVIRIDALMEQISIYFIPVFGSVCGHQSCCDVCDRVIALGLPETRLALGDWDPRDGIKKLAERLGLELPDHKPNADVVIESLLSSVATSTTLNELDISRGLTNGCILGALIGAVLGYWVLPEYLPQMDRFGCEFAGFLSGLLTGGIFGASIHAIIKRRSLPYQRIYSAIEKYSVDADSLARLADRHPRRVRAAALRARDSAVLSRLRPQ